MAPTRQKAVIVNEDGNVSLSETDVPELGSGDIRVKIVVAAQNPTDCELAFRIRRH